MSGITWRAAITTEMTTHGETFADVVQCTLSDAQLDEIFNDDYGRAQGAPFTLWTARRVYFPAVYDGSEWAASVPREPSHEATFHVGGE